MEDFGFPIGSRVVLVHDDPCGYVEVGMTGVVCDIDEEDMFSLNCKIGVRWDTYHHSYHDCCGHCDMNYGRYVPPECLELIVLDLGEIAVEANSIDSLFGTIL